MPAGRDQTVICRRVPGSGTQAAYNWFFQGYPCGAGEGDYVAVTRMNDSTGFQSSGSGSLQDPYVVDVTAGFTMLEHQTAEDVLNCLSKAAKGGIHLFLDEEGKNYKVDFGTGGYGAMGILSVEHLASSSGASDGWSFRALGGAGQYYGPSITNPTVVGTGVLPTKSNLIEGHYEFSIESTLQVRQDLSGLKLDFANLLLERLNTPSFYTMPWIAAIPSATNDPTVAPNISKATRMGRACAPLQLLYY